MKKINNSRESNFDFLALLHKILSNWLLLVLFFLLGAAIGLILGFQKPPIYQSSATFSVTIDYTQTGALSDLQEDQAMRNLGSILLSDLVIDQTLSNLQEEHSISLNKNKFLENGFADREEFRWTIRYQGKQPEIILAIVDEWSQMSEKVFVDALTHAQSAEAYLKILDNLQRCYQNAPEGFLEINCGFSTINEILKAIADVSEKIQIEKQSSLGLFYPVSVILVDRAYLPTGPIRNQINLFVLSGAFIGLLAGIIFLAIRYLSKWEPN